MISDSYNSENSDIKRNYKKREGKPRGKYRKKIYKTTDKDFINKEQILKQCFQDSDLANMDDDQMFYYIRDVAHIDLSKEKLAEYKKRFKNQIDEERLAWIEHYAKGGFVDFFKKRVEEAEYIQAMAFQELLEYKKKPKDERDLKDFAMLCNVIKNNNELLSQLGMATPVIAQVRAYIDELEKNKLENDAKTSIQSNNYLTLQTNNVGINDGNKDGSEGLGESVKNNHQQEQTSVSVLANQQRNSEQDENISKIIVTARDVDNTDGKQQHNESTNAVNSGPNTTSKSIPRVVDDPEEVF